MSLINGAEKAQLVRAFDAALSRLQAGEELAFTVHLASTGRNDNAVTVRYEARGGAHCQNAYPVAQVVRWGANNYAAELDSMLSALRKGAI